MKTSASPLAAIKGVAVFIMFLTEIIPISGSALAQDQSALRNTSRATMAGLGTRLQRFPGNYQQARAIFYGMGQYTE